MPADLDDPILDRVRAADPAHATPPGGRAHAGRQAVVAARRRRSVARAGAGGAGSLLAVGALAAVLSLSPAGEQGLDALVVRAAEASAPPPSSVVRVVSEVDVRWTGSQGPGGLSQRKVVWVRVGPDGRARDVRELVTRADGEGVEPVDETTTYGPDGPVHRSFDPSTGRTRTERGMRQVPSLVFRAHELLRLARDGRGEVRDAGTTVVDGRTVQRLTVTGIQERPVPGDREELLVDALTGDPVGRTSHSAGRDVHGDPFTWDLTERVVSHDVLPDDPTTARQLTLRGPTG
ncbi:hypothetical protein [Conexibacter sp. SYSU D00693]|uniref:hypothetical protein n=1 Tax=Conexibacter sp. SYSU D00693 TaxID=2812560 RepID=UPI00196B548A|nr:hypothetical protein [Conexibacter sp. SYSU D00693]